MSTSKKDVRKQQILILKYENHMAAAGALLTTFAVSAANAADKTLDGAASKALTPIVQAHFNAMQVCADKHEELRKCALENGALMVDGGVPKDPPAVMETLRSLLGFLQF